MSVTTEHTFEGNIEAHLLSHGWVKVSPPTTTRRSDSFPTR